MNRWSALNIIFLTISIVFCLYVLSGCRRSEIKNRAIDFYLSHEKNDSLKTISYPQGTPEEKSANEGSQIHSVKQNILIPGRTMVSAEFMQGRGDSLFMEGVSLRVPAGGLAHTITLAITGLLAEDLPPIPDEISNVTSNRYAGYRFLPHGLKFDSAATITIAYNNNLIPEGYTAQDVYTFYFDETDSKWKPLDRDSINTRLGSVVSKTMHFTDMINGIIKVPESPETEGFVPTSITDIKAADPTAGITLIEPPTANNTGDAVLSFPLKLPQGRSDIQPELTIQYSSDVGSGWTGYGWGLNLPSVAVDITWGVPRYLPDKESETYLYSGSQLTPVAHRGEYIDRTPEKRFYPRIEQDFSKIIRHGNNPTNYWWEVTTKDGTRNFFGGSPETGVIYTAVSSDANGNIGNWHLTETRDLHGNTVSYVYDKPAEYGQQIYIHEITYTGHSSEQGPYKVTFSRIDETSTYERKDARIYGNYGFIQRDKDLLRRINITFNGGSVRHYILNYREGLFAKTLLESITEYDAAGNEFYTHRFGYFDDTKKNNSFTPFASEDTLNVPDDGLKNPFLNPVNMFFDNISALGGSGSSGGSGKVSATVGLLDGKPFLKTLTAGGNVTYMSSDSEGFLTLIDLNGDGLPDKVYKKNNKVYYRPNLIGSPGKEMFGKETLIEGIDNISKSKTKGWGGGAEAHPVIFLGYDHSKTKTKTTVYFSDFNADGLVDLVNNGVVYFNHINANGDPVFTTTSELTPNPLYSNSQIDPSILPDPAREQAILEAQFPLHDAVRMWKAPFNGIISIGAPVHLVEDTSLTAREDNLRDGVIVSIQKNDTVLWRNEIDSKDTTEKMPPTDLIAINRGNQIYFRVQSRFNGSFDKVHWDPEIIYTSINGSDSLTKIKDSNRKNIGRYRSSEDFVLCGQQSIGMPKTGRVAIKTAFHKLITSDTVKLEIVSTDTLGNKSIIFNQEYYPSQSVNDSINRNIEVLRDEFLQFRVITSTNIDWSNIKWDTYAEYKRIDDSIPLTGNDGKPLLSFQAIPEFTEMFNNTVRYEFPVIADTAFMLSSGLDTVDNLAHPVHLSPLLTFSGSHGPHPGDKNTLSVKSQNRIYAEKKYQYNGVSFSDNDTLMANIRLGDTLYFEYHFTDFNLAESNTQARVIIGYDTLHPVRASVLSAILPENEIFGQQYRGWGQFDYNGNAERAAYPINESLLRLSEIQNKNVASMRDTAELNGVQNPLGEVFNIMVPYAVRSAFIGTDEQVYITSEYISSSRLGEKNVYVEPIVFSASGLNAVTKETQNSVNSVAAGGSIGPLGGSYSHSWGEQNFVTDMMDMNGDQYPDLLNTNRIQYTGVNGVLSGVSVNHFFGDHYSKSEAEGFTLGGDFVTSQSNNTLSPIPARGVKVIIGDNFKSNDKAKGAQETSKTSVGISVNFSDNSDYTDQTWIDINGDRLPDKIYNNGIVRLNLGYAFAPPEQWNFDAICKGVSKDYGGGLGVNIKNGSILAGVGISKTDNEANETLLDINSDGLPDMIKGSKVFINMGTGFAPPVDWPGLGPLDAGESIGESANIGFTIGIAIPIFMIKICVNPSAAVTRGISNTLTQLADIDGDGMADFLSSDSENEIKVRLSNIYRTNILKSVDNPLGGNFSIDYLLTPNTYKHPGGKLAIASVKIFDGLAGDGVDTTYTTFEYKNGFYDRHERQFYGFDTVKTNFHNTTNGSDIYRSVVQQYSNSDYYSNGMILSETLTDSEGKKQSGSQKIYTLHNSNTGELLDKSFAQSDREPIFVALEETRQHSYLGATEPLISTSVLYSYDTLGNISGYTDYSSGNISDKYSVSIKYHANSNKYLHSIPSSQEVTTNEGIRRKNETSINEFGDIIQIRKFITNDESVQFDLDYDEYGNLVRITRPANYKGERMWYSYDYDQIAHSYVTVVNDAFGYSSSAVYDYKWGLPISVTDMNNQETQYTFDDCGRMKTLTGPYELTAGRPYTIAFEYHPQAEVPYARTMHYDSIYDSNIETYSFSDGLGRNVQIKKTSLLFENESSEDSPGYIVSGKVMYDAFGRITEAYQPVFEAEGNPAKYNINPDNVPPVTKQYNVLDSVLLTTLPDGSKTIHRYNIGEYLGEKMFIDTLIDAMENMSVIFTKANGRHAATLKKPDDVDIVTNFGYNGIGELLTVTDPKGNKTISTYNMLGNRVSINQPDAGLTEFTYDGAGNLIKKITANLRKQIPDGGAISYQYDRERLTEVVYPRNVQNRVNFTYGQPGAPFNRAGRIVLIQDASGGQELFYSKLGEVTKTIRTIQLGESDMRTWIWSTTYDSWNRVQTMSYPDGEKVIYSYNRAGNLQKMTGEKMGRHYDYVSRIGYNKYEKQVYLKYGNGSVTKYDYEPNLMRLVQMELTANNSTLMDNRYNYDAVGNILSITNGTEPTGDMGGATSHNYSYDKLYRLTKATGTFNGKNKTINYTLAMQYDIMGNILHKSQSHNTGNEKQPGTTYDLEYRYGGSQPDAATEIGERLFTYDANGNPTRWQDTVSNGFRQLAWDEENRLTMVSDNGYLNRYVYDASGARVLKSHGGTQGVYINGAPAGIINHSSVNYTVYVSPYFVFKNEKFTKHYYAGSTRVTSKIGNGQFSNQYRPGVFEITAGGVNYINRQQQLANSKAGYEKQMGIAPGPPTMKGIYADPLFSGTAYPDAGAPGITPPRGWPQQPVFAPAGGPPGAPIQWGNKITNDNAEAGFGFAGNGSFDEILRYYYHSDQLGSTAYITNAVGDVTQFIAYMPYGETFAEHHSDWDSPLKFNAKELDNETGLYYYGSRYYDPKLSTWLGVDPLAEKYPSLSPYVYTADNPVIYTDPDGKEITVTGWFNSTITVTGKLINNSSVNFDKKQMEDYAARLKTSIESTYQHKGLFGWLFKYKTIVNITVASEERPLTETDHAFRIVDQGKIPGLQDEKDEVRMGTVGKVDKFGGKTIYFSSHLLTDPPKGRSLERSGPHELGHAAGLKHPTKGTMPGNIMHQSVNKKDAGTTVTWSQLNKIRKNYMSGKLNKK